MQQPFAAARKKRAGNAALVSGCMLSPETNELVDCSHLPPFNLCTTRQCNGWGEGRISLRPRPNEAAIRQGEIIRLARAVSEDPWLSPPCRPEDRDCKSVMAWCFVHTLMQRFSNVVVRSPRHLAGKPIRWVGRRFCSQAVLCVFSSPPHIPIQR